MDNDTKRYWKALEELTILLIKYVDFRLKNDVQAYIEKHYQDLKEKKIAEAEALFLIKAFTTRTSDLDKENKLLADADYWYETAMDVLDQDMRFDQALDILVPAFPTTKWVISKESDFDRYVGNESLEPKEVKNEASFRAISKHTKKTKKNLRKVLAKIRKRNAKGKAPEEGTDTIVAIFAEVDGTD